jgi:hypothetical protein
MSEEDKDVRKKASLFSEVMKSLKILILNQKLLKKTVLVREHNIKHK